MTVISIDSGVFCGGDDVAALVARALGCTCLSEERLLLDVAERAGTSEAALRKTLFGTTRSSPGLSDHGARHLAHLRAAWASQLAGGDMVYCGWTACAVPSEVSHLYRVMLPAPMAVRLARATARGVGQRDARRQIARDDDAHANACWSIAGAKLWAEETCDLLFPMTADNDPLAVERIAEIAGSPAVQRCAASERAVEDFALAAEVQLVLAEAGYSAEVTVAEGVARLKVHKRLLFLKRGLREMERLAGLVHGIDGANASISARYEASNMVADLCPQAPAPVLLVDDEREFVETLSERLRARDIPTDMAFDGESALQRVEQQRPEVMLLDLKMPGIDGLDVLRRVKADHPEVQVIILTGHGSDAEQVTAMELGAFAYLRKPIDIEQLTETMRSAYAALQGGETENQ